MRLGLEQLDQRSIDSRIYDALTERIVSGTIAPGMRITEELVAAEMGVSRTPVREAMRRLAQDELVELLPRRGVRVRKLDRQDVADAYEVRSVLEGLAAARAAEKLSEKDLRDLRARATKAREAAAEGRLDHLVAFDSLLHNLILERSGNRRLHRVLETLNNLVSFFRLQLGRAQHHAVEALGEHEQILDALERRDAADAERLMKAHVARAGQRVLQDTMFPSD